MKVGTKLILGFLVIYLLFGLAVSFSIYESSRALEKTASEGLLTLVQEVIDNMDRDLNERVEDFKVYSQDPLVKEYVMQSNKEFEALSDIQAYISQKDREWVSAPKTEVTPFMRQLIDNKLSSELREILDAYEEDYGHKVYGEVFITNKYGANIAQTGITSDYRQDDENWWQNAKADGVYVEEVKYDESADIYSIAIGIRIDDHRRFIGVIKVVLNIADVIRNIDESENEKTFSSAEFTLVDGHGGIIYSTRDYKIFEPYPQLDNVKSESGYFTHLDPQTGNKRLIVHAHSEGYRNFKGLGWILTADVEKDEIIMPINDLVLKILVFALALMAITIIIGYLIYSSISTSLRKFEGAIKDIATGNNMEAKVDIKTKDEFYALSLAFNSMADHLKSIKSTEKKQKMQKELDALKASYKTGFISEESYKKERKRLEENIIRANAVDAKLLKEKGFIKQNE